MSELKLEKHMAKVMANMDATEKLINRAAKSGLIGAVAVMNKHDLSNMVDGFFDFAFTAGYLKGAVSDDTEELFTDCDCDACQNSAPYSEGGNS